MRFNVLITVLTIPYLLACCACSASWGPRGYNVPSTRDYIFKSEIENSTAINALDLIESLRPHWLKGRGREIKYTGRKTSSLPIVYVDKQRLRYPLSLRDIPVYNIVEIQFISSGDATIWFGEGHSGGAILITMFF
ncbi:MAG: hypothetical protein V3W14_11950 [Candidatus Neomarinimicrobiota bacterium]